jgi:hypothetical protein
MDHAQPRDVRFVRRSPRSSFVRLRVAADNAYGAGVERTVHAAGQCARLSHERVRDDVEHNAARIDMLLVAGPCPDLSPYFPFLPPYTGPTIVFQRFAPRPAGDYHITVRLQDGARETILSDRRLVIHDDARTSKSAPG